MIFPNENVWFFAFFKFFLHTLRYWRKHYSCSYKIAIIFLCLFTNDTRKRPPKSMSNSSLKRRMLPLPFSLRCESHTHPGASTYERFMLMTIFENFTSLVETLNKKSSIQSFIFLLKYPPSFLHGMRRGVIMVHVT